MFIGKTSKHLFVLKPNREFYDVEADKIPAESLAKLEQYFKVFGEIQNYLSQVNIILRQTGAASIENVEIPECLKAKPSAPATKRSSSPNSKRRASSSSTKKKATNSGSQSTGATDAESADAK